MASIRKKSASRFWFACITLPSGKRRQFSTRTEDEAKALEIALRAENALKGKATRNALMRTLSALADEVTDSTRVEVVEWLRSWARRKKAEVSPATFVKYEALAEEAGGMLADEGVKFVGDITRAHVTALRDRWARLNATTTANSKLKMLRSALGEAVNDQVIAENPAAGIRTLKAKKSTRRAFSLPEVRSLIEVADVEWKALITLAVCYGPRRGDLIGLRWSSVDLAAGTIQFVTAKTGKPILLPIVGPAQAALESIPSADDPRAPVFPTIGRMTGNATTHAFHRLMVQAGLADARSHHKGKKATGKSTRRQSGELSFHSLRYTANSFLKGAGVPDAVVMAIVGHETRAMSDHYTGFDAATLRTALEKVDFDL